MIENYTRKLIPSTADSSIDVYALNDFLLLWRFLDAIDAVTML